jgi:uncharacterized 2Fe-2S/4Fe-4S cluster protein (DUF4445 family)
MSKHKVHFLPHNKTVEVKDGDNLIRAAIECGVHINASCGGEGVCGKCRIILEEGMVEGGISQQLDEADREKGYRLACLSTVRESITVRVPVESEVDASVLNRLSAPRRTAIAAGIDFEALKEEGLFVAPVEKHYLELPPPTPQDHVPDVTRLINHLRMTHNEHRLLVDISVIRKMPDVLRMDDFKVTVTLLRPVREVGTTKVINIESGDTTDRNYAIAMDIGTTTVYGQLLDMKSGEILAQRGDFNAQISLGEDVITRIMYAEKEGGLEKLQKSVVGTINKIIDSIIKKGGANRDEIATITMAGNTTMTQLLLRVNPMHIRRAPYVPAATIYPPVRAVELGIDLGDHTEAMVYTQVSSYVGGDIVAGVMGSGMYRTDKLTLFMDIGTNAEIVIGTSEWMACAACSAGPAFEGGGVKFGMRAAKGAIEDFSMDPVSLEPMILTVGNVKAKGICGSGLITIVATLFETGVIDNMGKFDRDLDTRRIREDQGVVEYVLVWREDTQIDRDIALTEIDIENLIRAKGAIYSGCMTMLDEVGMGIGDVEQIILAGGFGSYVDLEKAMVIGLLPEIESDKVKYIGNGSLMGARMSALTNRIRRDVVEVTDKMTNFELSETPSYMDHYVAALFLPHTDLNQFPNLKTRMEARKTVKPGLIRKTP